MTYLHQVCLCRRKTSHKLAACSSLTAALPAFKSLGEVQAKLWQVLSITMDNDFTMYNVINFQTCALWNVFFCKIFFSGYNCLFIWAHHESVCRFCFLMHTPSYWGDFALESRWWTYCTQHLCPRWWLALWWAVMAETAGASLSLVITGIISAPGI